MARVQTPPLLNPNYKKDGDLSCLVGDTNKNRGPIALIYCPGLALSQGCVFMTIYEDKPSPATVLLHSWGKEHSNAK